MTRDGTDFHRFFIYKQLHLRLSVLSMSSVVHLSSYFAPQRYAFSHNFMHAFDFFPEIFGRYKKNAFLCNENKNGMITNL